MTVSLTASANSANMHFYGERAKPDNEKGRVWCSVIISTIERDPSDRTGWRIKRIPDYYFTVYRTGEGEIGRFEYTPKTKPNPQALRDRTVTKLVNQFLLTA